MRAILIDWYLDYVNNYLTVARFAADNGLHVDEAQRLLELGKAMIDRSQPDS